MNDDLDPINEDDLRSPPEWFNPVTARLNWIQETLEEMGLSDRAQRALDQLQEDIRFYEIATKTEPELVAEHIPMTEEEHVRYLASLSMDDPPPIDHPPEEE